MTTRTIEVTTSGDLFPGSPLIQHLTTIRQYLFQQILRTVEAVQTGHLGACCSSLDLYTALYCGGILRYSVSDPKCPQRDFVLNRGHLGPLKYNLFALLGWLRHDETTAYRQFGSRLPGHEDMTITPGVDISPSGSLGMTLSYGVGAATGARDAGQSNRFFCFLGDGEEQEGNVSEAARHASSLGLTNLICVIDANGGQLSTRPSATDRAANLQTIWEGYGWQVITLANGHDLGCVLEAYQMAISLVSNGPVCIIAKTIKGYGIPGCEDDYCGFHVYHGAEAKSQQETVRSIDLASAMRSAPIISLEEAQTALRALDIKDIHTVSNGAPELTSPSVELNIPATSGIRSIYDAEHAILLELEKQLDTRLYVLTADYPIRSLVYETGKCCLTRCHYYNVGIREQHMTAFAHGLAQTRRDAMIVILCGDAFVYRHMDQINVLAQAQTPVIFLAVQGGLSGGQNGPTHQSSGQIGGLVSMPGITVEEPATAEDLVLAMRSAVMRAAPTYIRLHKAPIPWTYGGERHTGYEVIHQHNEAMGTIVTSGMLTAEAVAAVRELAVAGHYWNLISITRVSDCNGVSGHIPTNKPLHVLYNGNPYILSSAVLQDFATHRRPFPTDFTQRGFTLGVTGQINDLLKHFQVDRQAIVNLGT